MVRPAAGVGIPWCSSTRSSSGSATASPAIDPSTWPSGSPAPGTETSSDCGLATVAKPRSSGCRCSPRSRTAAPPMCASWSATALKGYPMRSTPCGREPSPQMCVIHLLRNTFRYASRKFWDSIAKDIRPDLHRTDGGRSQGTLHRIPRQVGGWAVSGDHPAVGQRLERVRAVPGLRRRRDPPRHLQHQRWNP